MREYVNRVKKMLSKLSKEQVEEILDSIAKQNEMLDSVLESLSTGLVVVDLDWKIIKINKMAERYFSFIYYSDESKFENTALFDFISESEIQSFLRECAEKEKYNVSEEFSITTSSGSVRFISVSVLSLIYKNEMKGRIIGREGRNIRTLETITGVDLIIDDTPEVITVSSFNPLRREIAKRTLEYLIKDGRIQPDHSQ